MIPQPVEGPPNTEAKRILPYTDGIFPCLSNYLLLHDESKLLILFWQLASYLQLLLTRNRAILLAKKKESQNYIYGGNIWVQYLSLFWCSFSSAYCPLGLTARVGDTIPVVELDCFF